MVKVVTKPPYPPVFETTLGLRLFYCLRSPKLQGWAFGPAALSPGKVAFSFTAQGSYQAVVNGQRRLCRPGNLLVQRPGDISSYRQMGSQRVTILGFGVECDQGGVANVLLQRDFRVHYTLADPGGFTERFNRLLAALKEPRHLREWTVAGALVNMVEFILRETNPALRRGLTSTAAQKARDARAWAMENIGRAFTVTDWARAIGAPASFFERGFRQQFGLSAKRWLENQRMLAARHHLLSTSKSVKEIAFAVGYEDPFYFSRVFHKRFGQSPREYRQAGATF
jgi:AraC-like DNA-binding protein